MRALSRRDRGARGAAAVEFGIIAPLLLALVFGIIDFGWMLMHANMVNNIARDGVRAASLNQNYSEVNTAITTELTSAGIDTADVTRTITCTNASGTNCDGTEASFNSRAVSGSRLLVTLSYSHEWITPFGALCGILGPGGACTGDSITLRRTAVMVRE